MSTLPVIVEKVSSEPKNGTLGVLSPGSSGGRETEIRDMDAGKLQKSLAKLYENAATIFQDMKKVGDFQLREVQLQVEITAEGGFALIGTAKAGAKGRAVKL